jgi:hypothetical protein
MQEHVWKVKFYGVRSSIPVCHQDFQVFGGNTTCFYLDLLVNDHGKKVTPIFDAGTGIRQLGGVSDGMANIEPSLRFSVYYPKISRRVMRARQADRFAPIQNVYVQPDFFNVGRPEPGKSYTSVHPEKVILQEMSKQQIKRYIKSRPTRVIIVE